MSKRTKKSRSVLKLETLEQRQLLASIVAGSGTEVNSNVKLANGNTYDQIMMDSSSVTVKADAGQITRVDFLDANGDIVRAEISGAGELKIDLADFKAAAAPTEYKTDTKYVQGLATFTISGSDASTNFNVHSLGTSNVFLNGDNPIFDGGKKDGGNNVANVAALVIQGNPASPVGNAFGSVYAGNAVFGASSGAVGIVAPNVQFTGTITIGDIDATDKATPVLQLGQFSDTKTVTVAGGDLKSTNKLALDTSNVSKLVSSTGTNSNGTQLETQIIAAASTDIAAANISYTSAAETVTIDGSKITQAELDVYASKFLNDVVINGGLAEGLVFGARSFGDITVKGDLAGLITTDVIADGEGAADDGELGIGDVVIEGDIVAGGAIEAATWIGDVTVKGNLDFTADDDSLDDFAWGEWADGDITAAAVISTLANDALSSKIGNITFGVAGDDETGAVDLSDVMALVKSGVVAANVDADNGAGIGDITAFSITSSLANAIQALGAGNVGKITTEDALSLNNLTSAGSIGAIKGATVTLGVVTAAKSVGNIESEGALTTGNITATDGTIGTITSDGATTLGNLSSNAAADASGGIGAINSGDGALTIGTVGTDGNVGAITSGGALGLGAVTAGTGSVGNLTSDGTMTLAGVTAKSVGNLTVNDDGADLLINGNITASDSSIGNIMNKGDNGSSDVTLANGVVVKAKTSIGNISLAGGTLTFSDNAAKFVAVKDAAALAGAGDWAGTSIGNVTVVGGIVGAAGSIEFQANKIGNVSVTGAAATASLLNNVIFSAHGTVKATVESASIGNITLDSTANTDTDGGGADTAGAIADGAASTTATTGTGFSSSGSIGNISIKTAIDGRIVDDGTSGLIFRAGSSLMGLEADTAVDGADDGTDNNDETYLLGTDNTGGVSIGSVFVEANLSAALTGAGGTAGTGLVVASGVNVATAGVFVSAGAAADLTGAAKLGTGGTIGAVTINDLSGLVGIGGFTSGALAEADSDGGGADTADEALTAGSVIVADKITSIEVNTGTNLLDIDPTGIALKGVVATDALASNVNAYESGTLNNLFIVIL